jgi:hypothetical protein
MERETDVQKRDLVLLSRLSQYNDRIKTIKGEALFLYKDSSKTLSFRAIVVVDDRTKRLRLELTDYVFKKPVITIVRNAEEIVAVLYTKKEYYRLQYSSLDIEKLTGLEIPKEILMPSLLGKVYTGTGSGIVSTVNANTLQIDNGDFTQDVFFNETLLPIRTLFRLAHGSYNLIFNNFLKLQDTQFPQKIIVKNNDRFLEISYTSVLINQELDFRSFQIDELNLTDFNRASASM